jgi:hypothetical protein
MENFLPQFHVKVLCGMISGLSLALAVFLSVEKPRCLVCLVFCTSVLAVPMTIDY